MAIFCPKRLAIAKPTNELFKEARLSQGLDFDVLSRRTRVPKKYLMAMEEGAFQQLPEAKGYKLAYIREYAEALNLNPPLAAYQFAQEISADNEQTALPKKFIKISHLHSIASLTRNLAVALFVVSFLGYLAWQIRGILQPPRLSLYSPNEGYVTSDLHATVQGQTEKEVKLLINGKELMPNEGGGFETVVDLLNGVNTITISAIKKHGKTATVTRHVVVKNKAKNREKMTLKNDSHELDNQQEIW